MQSVEQVINKFLNDVAKNIIKQQKERKMRASGKSAASLKVVKDKAGKQHLVGDESFYFQIHGRAPGKMPPIEKMIEYVRVKRLKASPWALAKSIAKKGTLIWQGKRKGLNIKEAYEPLEEPFIENLTKALMNETFKSIQKGIKK